MNIRQVFGAFSTVLILCAVVIAAPNGARAAPYADMVIDARSGEILRATNADSRLHPASLTKMMTLYITFEAIRLGEISPDTMVTISSKAASEPPSKLGLRAGQRIQLRYLIRAASVKSANDAATALGEAVAGSEAAFARRMNRTARALGMTRTTFKNAHGLTEEGHLSTARDMTTLGRHLFFDYPQYYNLFSRRSTNAGGTEVNNTNRRFLDAYKGADGIKTGYTRAAGFNLVASAERGRERIIATVFGGSSTANRNARVAELLDLGFSKAPTRVAVNRPSLPRYDNLPPEPEVAVAAAPDAARTRVAGQILRISGAVTRSPRPRAREMPVPDALIAAIETDIAAAVAAVATTDAVTEAVTVAAATSAAEGAAISVAEVTAEAGPGEALLAEAAPEAEPATARAEAIVVAATDPALAAVGPARPRPEGFAADVPASTDPVEVAALAPEPAAEVELEAEKVNIAAPESTPDSAATSEPLLAEASEGANPGADATEAISLLADAATAPAADTDTATRIATLAPAPQPGLLAALGALAPDPQPHAAPEPTLAAPVALAMAPTVSDPVIRPEPVAAQIVSRLSTSGGRHSGVSLGRFPSRNEAERVLIKASLSDLAGLGGSLRRIVQRSGGFEANLMGMSSDQAALACRRITARGNTCETIGE